MDPYVQLRARLGSLPEDDLVKCLETEEGPFCFDELERRRAEKLANKMVRYTAWIVVMTLVMTAATILNVLIACLRE